MVFGRNRKDDGDDERAAWRVQGERYAKKARVGLGTSEAPVVNALLAIYAELRHQHENPPPGG